MQTDTINLFYQKFHSLDDDELKMIARSNIKYILEARFAAVMILKERNVSSQYITDIEMEVSKLEEDGRQKLNIQKIEDREILTFLQGATKKRKFEFTLNNGNELQITKISDKFYQIRIEHFRSIFSPVVILKVGKNNIKYWPFFYYLPFLLTLIISFLMIWYSYSQDGYVSDIIIKVLTLLWLFDLFIQIILMPFKCKVIIETFKDQLLNRSH